MPANRWSRKPSIRRRYGWVLNFAATSPRIRALSRQAKEGHRYAEDLARNARERREQGLEEFRPERLTVKRLADQLDVPAGEVYARLRQLRVELFGKDLSDSAIYYRLQQERQRLAREPRVCAQEGCGELLPEEAIASRRYCEWHRSPVARVTRSRARAQARPP